VRVILFEGTDRVLRAYPPKLSTAAKESLEKRRAEVRLNTLVTAIDATGVTVKTASGEERIGVRTILWAAGVQASSLAAFLGAPRDRSGRVIVNPDLSIPDRPNVFVIGDLAKVMIAAGAQEEVPGVAQGALQGGRHVAKIIATEAAGQISERPAFRYHDKGNMATIGRAEAVVATKSVAIHGLIAWLMWWAVHIFFLVGFRNRVLVMLNWMWSWLTFQRGARLITGPVGPLPPITTIDEHGDIPLPSAAKTVELRDLPS